MITLICKSFAFLCFVFSISACSRVKNYFPDKAKDYQLTSEIPELNVPADLSDSAILKQEQPVLSGRDIEVNEILSELKRREVERLNPTESAPQIAAAERVEASKKESTVYIELVEFSGGATRIRIEDSMERIWRTVGKALSRHSIEIIDRNDLDRVYFVQYDADFKQVKDGSLWDEAVFIFGANPAQEEEFRIKLVEYGGFIEIIVLNKYDIPLSKGDGLTLLKTLFKTIKADLAR